MEVGIEERPLQSVCYRSRDTLKRLYWRMGRRVAIAFLSPGPELSMEYMR